MSEINPNTPAPPPAKRNRPPILVPLVFLAVLTSVIRLLDLDLKIALHFYGGDGVWPMDRQPAIQLLYRFGTWPAIGATIIAGAILLVSFARTELVRFRGLALFLALVMAIGPGLIVNSVFKQNFGRPRPRETMQFGGDKAFLPVWQPDFSQEATSFPSGHASMSFYWICLGVFFWERNRRSASVWLIVGLGYGSLMGYARIVQGGHWLSDVLWSAGFVYLTSWLLYRVLRLSPPQSPEQIGSDAIRS